MKDRILDAITERIVQEAGNRKARHEKNLHESNPRFDIDYWVEEVLVETLDNLVRRD